MALGDGIRRNVADVSDEERQRLKNAIVQLHKKFFPGSRDDTPTGGVSYWFKQDEIHAHTHVHASPAFLPWHREIVNRFEAMIREVDPALSLHYWDWTTDPTSSPSSRGGNVNLFTDQFMGSAKNEAGEPWKSNGFYDADAPNTRSDSEFDPNNNPFDPPARLTRDVGSGALVTVSADNDALAQPNYPLFWRAIRPSHDDTHTYIGGTISDPHTSFRDPFVFLLHSNVDRLFAKWQLSQDVSVRVDPDYIYGTEGNSTGSGNILGFANWGILSPVEPWAGPAAQNSSTGVVLNVRATRPWAPPENEQTHPNNSKDHRHWSIVSPPCYDTNPTVVEPLNSGNTISFNQVPSGETTIRAATFRFISCYPLTFTVSTLPSLPFKVFSTDNKVSASRNHDTIWTEARMWFSFTGSVPNTSESPSTVVIHCESLDFSADFTFTLTGNSIARPTAAVIMALDQSGSMDEQAGLTGLRRIDALRYAAKTFVEVTPPGNAIGLIRFDDPAYAVNDPTYPGLALTPIGEGVLDSGRSRARDAVNAHRVNPSGATSIGAGIVMAHDVLGAPAGFDVRAMIVFTDGLENRSPFIRDVIGSINARTFAVGLGNPQQISTVALTAICNATKGYTYITGLLGPTDEDFFMLTKYFLQILAGVTNADIVKDPTGFLPLGVEIRVPFDMAEVDIESTVLLLSDLPAIDLQLETPTGQRITPATANANHIRFYDAFPSTFYRFMLPATIGTTTEPHGTWHAILRIDDRRFKKYCSGQIDDNQGLDPLVSAILQNKTKTPCSRGGVRYSVIVTAWSNLHMKADVYQDRPQPGANMTVRVLLDEYGIPFPGQALVAMEVTLPDSTVMRVRLEPAHSDGVYEGSIVAKYPGVYVFHVFASGMTTKSQRFTREALLTASTIDPEQQPGPNDRR